LELRLTELSRLKEDYEKEMTVRGQLEEERASLKKQIEEQQLSTSKVAEDKLHIEEAHQQELAELQKLRRTVEEMVLLAFHYREFVFLNYVNNRATCWSPKTRS